MKSMCASIHAFMVERLTISDERNVRNRRITTTLKHETSLQKRQMLFFISFIGASPSIVVHQGQQCSGIPYRRRPTSHLQNNSLSRFVMLPRRSQKRESMVKRETQNTRPSSTASEFSRDVLRLLFVFTTQSNLG